MSDRLQRIKRFSDLHVSARIKANKSQDYMAMELGVAKKTVQNWEKGISSPSFFQSLEWFRVLGINPLPYYVTCVYPDTSTKMNKDTPDEKVDEAFNTLITQMSTSSKRALLYLFYGEHGSSPNAVIQLLLAHLHSPMRSRALFANFVSQTYEMDEKMGNIVCPNNILPNIEALNKAIESAKNATINNKTSYTDIEKEEDAD